MKTGAFSGTWRARLVSPAGNVHDFKLVIRDADAPTPASLSMERTRAGESAPSSVVAFATKTSLSPPFIGMLSQDPGSHGFNCMGLHLGNDPDVLNGHIIWNSLSEDCIRDAGIVFQRVGEQK